MGHTPGRSARYATAGVAPASSGKSPVRVSAAPAGRENTEWEGPQVHARDGTMPAEPATDGSPTTWSGSKAEQPQLHPEHHLCITEEDGPVTRALRKPGPSLPSGPGNNQAGTGEGASHADQRRQRRPPPRSFRIETGARGPPLPTRHGTLRLRRERVGGPPGKPGKTVAVPHDPTGKQVTGGRSCPKDGCAHVMQCSQYSGASGMSAG